MSNQLLDSTTFKFCLLVMIAGAIVAGFSDELSWLVWFEKSVYFVGIYATKEGVRYGAEAHGSKNEN